MCAATHKLWIRKPRLALPSGKGSRFILCAGIKRPVSHLRFVRKLAPLQSPCWFCQESHSSPEIGPFVPSAKARADRLGPVLSITTFIEHRCPFPHLLQPDADLVFYGEHLMLAAACFSTCCSCCLC